METLVSSTLYQFGEMGLKAPESIYEEGRHLAQNVFRELQKSPKLSIAGPIFAGSFGKKTDVIQPDLDLVVIVNNCQPPYKDILDDFENILDLNEAKLNIIAGTVEQKTKHSVQFVFNNGIDVDLLPAANIEPKEVYKVFEMDPERAFNYSTCLATKQIEFVKSHPSSFAHCLIRLIKFWFKSLIGVGKFSGASLMMEVVGIAAAEIEEKNFNSSDTLRAFTRAIDWFCRLKTIKLAFREVSDGRWYLVPSGELNMGGKAKLIPSVVGTADILRRDYFIIDPANPYNDLLQQFRKNPTKLEKIMEFAAVTRERLRKIVNGNPAYVTHDLPTNTVDVDILKLFQAQPQASESSIDFPFAIPKDCHVDYYYQTSSGYPDMKVRNERLYEKPEVKRMVWVLKWDLICAIKSVIHGNPQKTIKKSPNDLRGTVANSVQKVIEESLNVKLGPAGRDRHEEMDITLTIPYYGLDGEVTGYGAKCSFSWEKM